jgi:hypothetical protein
MRNQQQKQQQVLNDQWVIKEIRGKRFKFPEQNETINKTLWVGYSKSNSEREVFNYKY